MDWRLVLENPQFDWPADVIAEATRLRDAERPHQIGDRAVNDPLEAIEALVVPDASYHAHPVHGGEIRIPISSHSDAIRVMREARLALMALRGEVRVPAHAASSINWPKIARANADDNGLMGMGPVPPETQTAACPIWRHTLHVPGVRPVVLETDTFQNPFGEVGVDYDAEGVVHSARCQDPGPLGMVDTTGASHE